MSLEAWGDEGLDGYFTEERVEQIGVELFRVGAQMCREMMARFLEQGGDVAHAASVRANWNPEWGEDPGRPSDEQYTQARSKFSMWDWEP